MRILFLPLITGGPAIGTITRCLAVADHLRGCGHDVFFLTNGEGAKYAGEAGYPVTEGVIPDRPGPPRSVHSLSDVAVFLGLCEESYIRKALEAEKDAVDRFRPDILFSEFKLTASITASETGLPLVSTACSPGDPRFTSPLYPHGEPSVRTRAAEGFNRVLHERGLEPVQDVAELFFGRSDLKIAPTIVDLEPLIGDVPGLHYVGYLLYDRSELAPLPEGLMGKTAGKDIVFVYFSMGDVTPSMYTRVIPQAFEGTEFHAVVAVGDHPDLRDLPQDTANTTWLRFVPGRSILSCSSAVIFHGGQNTAMASLIHKTPSLIVPGGDFERDFNARGMERIGVAIRMDVEDFTPHGVLEAVRELRSNSYEEALESYSQEVIAHGGPRRAADLVMNRAAHSG